MGKNWQMHNLPFQEVMNEYDDREFHDDTHTLLHRALKLVRECERFNIDYTSYCNNDELNELIEILNCCLNNKDSKYILRTD